MRYLVILAVLLPAFSAEAEEWEARSRRPSRRHESQSNYRYVSPTVGLYAGGVYFEGAHWVPSGERIFMAGAWLGMSFHPVNDRAMPFLAVGTELNLVGFSGGAFFEFVPELRAGVMTNGADDVDFLPDVELYGIGGFRVGNGLRESTVRVGAGLSIPAFAVAQHHFFKPIGGIPIIPWMVEVFYDLSPEQEVGFRFGYHF